MFIVVHVRAGTIYRDIDKIDLELVWYAYRDVNGNIDPENKIHALLNARFSVDKPGTIVLWKMATETTHENSWVSLDTPTIKKSNVWTHFGFPVYDNEQKKLQTSKKRHVANVK